MESSELLLFSITCRDGCEAAGARRRIQQAATSFAFARHTSAAWHRRWTRTTPWASLGHPGGPLVLCLLGSISLALSPTTARLMVQPQPWMALQDEWRLRSVIKQISSKASGSRVS